ncbi:MAG: hypothetical protein B7C24_03880 [Bacteroidetes bacterium 4572_77]|nr:MAG: hypothetical protein B7C24_03880 [Bacteroidetes bacterium 4572_77]
MQKLITLFLILISFNNLSAQTDEQILNEILFELFGFQSQIISEWKNNEENKGFKANWNEQDLNKIDSIFTENDTIIGEKPIFKSLTRNEMNQIFERTQKRQKIYSVSKILFDESKENAVFHFTTIPWHGYFSSETILIKKIFGKWIIVTRFDFVMT